MTIANEEFLNGGTFYGPGAGLVQAGFSYWPSLTEVVESHEYSTYWTGTFGTPVDLDNYKDKNSDVMKNISAVPSISKQWDVLGVEDCKKEYISCSGLKRHRSVVLVVNQPGGWIRKDMWHLMDNQTEFWNRYMPSDQPNHLFYSAQCVMFASRSNDSPTQCVNNCYEAMGWTGVTSQAEFAATSDWEYPFFNETTVELVDGTRMVDPYPYHSLNHSLQQEGSQLTSGLQPGAVDLPIKYCLAEPVERVCHVALSPTLLLAVTICVIFKTCTAIVVTVVLSRQNQAPLVTLGDAMESFIEKPDPVTAGMCTLGQSEIRRTIVSDRAFLVPGPKQWLASQRRRAGVLPKSVWFTSYLLFAIGISVIVYFFNDLRKSGPL